MLKEKFGFPVSSPEAQGLSSYDILSFIETVEKEHIELHSLIIMRHGHIVTEGYWAPFSQHKVHRMFSAGKVVVSTAILFAIQEGLLKLDDRIVDFFPESIPENPSENLKKMNIYHLLTMTTGHIEDTFAKMLQPGSDRAALFLNQEVVHEPGLYFLYNNGVPDILGLILYKVTSLTVFDYLRPRLFEPLGLTGMRVAMNGHLNELPTMCSTTWDLLKITLLYANGGRWEGKQLLQPQYIKEACSCLVPTIHDPLPPIVNSDGISGYGYQIWRNSIGGFRLDGGRGQFGIVVPELDLVIALNSNEVYSPNILAVLWEKIAKRLYAKPLTENTEAFSNLCSKLDALTWSAAESCEPREDFSGEYVFDKEFLGREKLSIEFITGDIYLRTYRNNDVCSLKIGKPGLWEAGHTPFDFAEQQGGMGVRLDIVTGIDAAGVFSTGRWISSATLEITLRSDGWMGAHIIFFDFSTDNLSVTHEDGVSYNLRHRSNYLAAAIPNMDGLVHSTTVGMKKAN